MAAEGRRQGVELLTINVAVLLAVIVVLRLRRRTESRSRNDEQLTVVLCVVLGVLLAPTELGEGVLRITRQLVEALSEAAR